MGKRIEVIDGYDLGIQYRTGIYVIQEEALTLVETGPSPSVTYIEEGLEKLGHSLEDVRYIIVTHIHLDHAGGAGLLLEKCPNATILVHEKGFRHLADPSRLIAGAKMVYKDQFDALFNPVMPVPKDRMRAVGEGDLVKIGSNCVLEFWDTPGHANHHLAIYDPVSNGIFTGDTVGIRYEQLAADHIPFYLPSTSPNQFNPTAMFAAIERMKTKNVSTIYFGHYGYTEQVDEVYRQIEVWLPIFVEEARFVFKEVGTADKLAQRLMDKVQQSLQQMGVSDDHIVYSIITVDLQVSSMGLLEYVQKNHFNR